MIDEHKARCSNREAFNREYLIPLTFRWGLIKETERKAKGGRTGSKRAKRGKRRRLKAQKRPVDPRGTILQMGLRFPLSHAGREEYERAIHAKSAKLEQPVGQECIVRNTNS